MTGNRVVQLYSPEKLDEFAEMTVEARLQWLEEINRFINTVLGFEKRAETDDRFRDFPPPTTASVDLPVSK